MRISDRLPAFLARRLEGRDTLRRSLDNSFWLFADQVLRMGLGLVIGLWVARYLGPAQFGWLSYATAVVGTVATVTSLGLNAVVVRELVRDPAATPGWLGAALWLRSAGAAVGFLVCVAVAFVQDGASAPARPLLVIVGLGLFCQLGDVVDLLFQAEGRQQVSAWIRMAACVAANLAKLALLLEGASLPWLAAAGVLELALAAAGWTGVAVHRGLRVAPPRRAGAQVAVLLREGWPLALSGLAVYAQAYADQIMIAALLGPGELGQYAAATRLVTAFGFIPMVVYTVAAPEITRAHRDDPALYRLRLFRLYRVMGVLFVAVALPLALLGPLAARALLGPAYVAGSALLPWMAVRLLFTNLGVARGVFLTNEGLFRFGLVTALAGAAVNLALNLVWIPAYGARGAIGASLAGFAVTTFGLEGFHPRARANLRLMGRAVLLPWRARPD